MHFLKLHNLLPCLLALLAAGCAHITSHEMLNATLWQQTAGEYQAVARQTYRLAGDRLEEALADPGWTAALEQTAPYDALPPAIVVDLDETILDNSAYEAKIITALGQYSHASFADWCETAAAPAVPGSREFLVSTANRGVEIFYYSARREHLRACTTRNLVQAGFPYTESRQLLLNSGASKSEHRENIAGTHRILLLIGDNLEDFVDGSKALPEERKALAERYRERWGREWIVLPNPIYGHWESSSYNFDYALPRQQQLQMKYRELESY